MKEIVPGKLRKVNPREIWQTEDGDFTPWLAKEENIEVLGETIGIELVTEISDRSIF